MVKRFANWLVLGTMLMGVYTLPAVVGTALAQGHPTPSVVSKSWELGFTHSDPRPMAVQDLEGKYQWYWYITYKVTNLTGAERLFVPEFTIAADTGEIFQANRNVPGDVFKAIKDHLGNQLLESPAHVVGQLLQGADHAKESVIIWRDPGVEVSRISIFVAGLSGETAVIKNPDTGAEVLLSRTWMVDYALPGRPMLPQQQTVVKGQARWVMR